MQKLYVNIDELINHLEIMKHYQIDIDDVIDLLHMLKTNKILDVKEINQGRWKYISTDKKGNMLYECPFCSEQQQGMSQYCGLCGAELEPDWPGRENE